jgi:hypothetical protein
MKGKRVSVRVFVPLALLVAVAALAAPPETYVLTQVWSIEGTPAHRTVTIAKSKDHVLIDQVVPATKLAPAHHDREIVDLERHVRWAWEVDGAKGAPCLPSPQLERGGKWLWTNDPFSELADDFGGDLDALHPRLIEKGSIAGLPAEHLELTVPGAGTVRVWVHRGYGLLLRMDDPEGKAGPVEEITRFSLAPPPASVFALPAGCPAK